MVEKKIKVAWICCVSNHEIRRNLDLRLPLWRKLLKLLRIGNIGDIVSDNSQWNTNAISEFTNINDVELHVVFVHANMRKSYQSFSFNGIQYYGISLGDTSFFTTVYRHLCNFDYYKKTWKIIESTIKGIKPDVVHIIGAENPSYSMSALLLPLHIPMLVQLQTFLNDPSVDVPYSSGQKKSEYEVIKRANYIGTGLKLYADLLRANIKKNAVVFATSLMVAEKPNLSRSDKHYDFVYFARQINKSIDLALDAFAIAHKKHPELTLLVIGGASNTEFSALNSRIKEQGCSTNVYFVGELPTHNDVIEHIRKARYALLPLKLDAVSGTIREAMWNGLPVITTITSGTPSLNEKRESVLLSVTGDNSAMAANICKVVENNDLAERLRMNASLTVEEMYGNNRKIALDWVSVYKACINHFNKGVQIPENLLYYK